MDRKLPIFMLSEKLNLNIDFETLYTHQCFDSKSLSIVLIDRVKVGI